MLSQFGVRIKASRLLLNAMAHERLSLPIEGYTAQSQQGLSTGNGPMHARSLHPILDHMPAGALNDPGSDRVASGQVLVVVHPGLMATQVVADLGQLLPSTPGEPYLHRCILQ